MDNKVRIKRWQNFNENSSIRIDYLTDKDSIVSYIKSLPIKYILKTKWGSSYTNYGNSIDTAINNSAITRFYLEYHRDNKKSTKIIYTPSLEVGLYDKLNYIIDMCDLYLSNDKGSHPSTKARRREIDNRLFRAICFQLMDALLFEAYFNVDFRYGNVHDIVRNIQLPNNENEYYLLFENINNRESDIRHILFYMDTIPLISTILKK